MSSSPTYPQSNGKVEAAVKSAKSVMKKSRQAKTDPCLALLEYRKTPSQGMESNGIPPELGKLRKAPFKRKLTHLLLRIVETEEINVDMCYNSVT